MARLANNLFKSSAGVSFVELMVVMGVMAILMLTVVEMQGFQMKSNNFVEFQLKRTQLHGSILGQFLSDPVNCACMFAGASPFPVMPAAPGAVLTGVAPTTIGRYNFVTPGDCTTATVPAPLATNAGVDRIKVNSISLMNIMNVGGKYLGDLVVNVESQKEVLGPKALPVSIPVQVETTPAGPVVNFSSCSVVGAAQAPLAMVSMRCLWSVGSGFGACVPDACPAGTTDVGVNFTEVTSSYGSWTQGHVVRSCYFNTVDNVLELKCPWSQSGGFGSCVPPACPVGFNEIGLTQELTNTYGTYVVGNTVRVCKN
jgi:hypothetical protein